MDELQPRRGPGRPPKYIETNALATADTSAPSTETTLARRKEARVPFGGMQLKMQYPERPGYHRHRFNDWPGRIQQALDAGYSHVTDREGKNVCWVGGTAEGGGPLHVYLMEIPDEWYQEDMARNLEEPAAREAAIKRASVANAGQDAGNFYPGKEGISIKKG